LRFVTTQSFMLAQSSGYNKKDTKKLKKLKKLSRREIIGRVHYIFVFLEKGVRIILFFIYILILL